MKKKIFCVMGTRPEAIKMAPVAIALRKESWASVKVVATGQHRHIFSQVLTFFGLEPDIDLDIMQPNQSLSELTSRLLLQINKMIASEKPDAVLIQGDTTTVMVMAMACFYHQIPVGHVEAGLRTWNIQSPFPEEANRVIVSRLASWHFAPTRASQQNLMRDNCNYSDVVVTGNTVIDALLMTSSKELDIGLELDSSKRLVLVTAHRRESFGEPILAICRALKILAEGNSDCQFLFPVHPNPNVKEVVNQKLADLPNVVLCDPLSYPEFVEAMKQSYLILTDSGGVQEEAPMLGKPVLVLRNETERHEAVEEGVVKLVGTSFDAIVGETQNLLDNKHAYNEMARGISPYGDGEAAARIVHFLKKRLISSNRDE